MNQKQIMKKHEQLIEKAVKLITSAYTVYFDSVTEFLLDAMTADDEIKPKYSEAYVYSSLEVRRKQLEEYLTELTNKELEDAFLLGILFFEQSVKEATEHSFASATIKQETVHLLQEVTRNTEMRIKRVVREAYQSQLLDSVARRRSMLRELEIMQNKPTAEQFKKALDKEGFVGIVDKAGRRWKPDVYAKMVFRTKVMESNIAIQQEQGKQFGIDLAYISGVPVDNPCNNWIGVIISMNGADPRFPTYQQVKDTTEIFHPNCQHYLIPLADISYAPDYVITATEQKYSMNLREYK